ncbi:MAG: hypothetical protein BWK79_14450, partial [Beggiatoa sp. IS2]
MDALKRAETIKQHAQHDEETDNVELSPQNELPTDQITQSLEKEGDEWEGTFSHLDVQEQELKLEEDTTEPTVKDWTNALLFNVDDDDTPLQLEEAPKAETISPPLIWEEAILPEFNDDGVPFIEKEFVPILAEEKPHEIPVILTPASIDDTSIAKTQEIFDNTIEISAPVVDSVEIVNPIENVEEEDFAEISIKNDHLKFTDWVDDYIDEEALRKAHPKNTQEQHNIDEELSLLEKLAEGNAVHPNVAKRLLTARGKSPRLPKSTLRLLGLLGMVVVGLGGGFAYYYFAIDTGGVRFNRDVRFTSPPSKLLPTETKSEEIAEMSPVSESGVDV